MYFSRRRRLSLRLRASPSQSPSLQSPSIHPVRSARAFRPSLHARAVSYSDHGPSGKLINLSVHLYGIMLCVYVPSAFSSIVSIQTLLQLVYYTLAIHCLVRNLLNSKTATASVSSDRWRDLSTNHFHCYIFIFGMPSLLENKKIEHFLFLILLYFII